MATAPIPIVEPLPRPSRPQAPGPTPPPPRGAALWALGFRPFYLLAAALAVVSVPLWALQYAGWLPHAVLRGPAWHAHEMIFGTTLAIVVGFLFTAGRNWSGQPTPTGRPLMALAAVWLAARVLVLTPWALLAALASMAFPLGAAWGLWAALRAGGNSRNYFFVGLLVLMAVACGAFHLNQAGVLPVPASLGLPVALDVVLFIIAVMGGRVIPMFSNNGVPGLQATRKPGLEKAVLGGVIALIAADALGAHGPVFAVALVALAALHAARLALWQPWRTLRHPLVWVLHLAYAWVPVHLGLRAAVELGGLMPGLATHALTVGVIGTITLGMMTRTALGHTGRPLQAGGPETAAYLLVTLAAVVRVGVPLLNLAWLREAALASALLWAGAYAVYLVRYAPWLTSPRLDGRPG